MPVHIGDLTPAAISKQASNSIVDILANNTVARTMKGWDESLSNFCLSKQEDSEARYDADVSLHGHFKCEKCDRIFDFEVEPSTLKFNGLKYYQLNEIQVSCKGFCPSCRPEK